MLEIDKIYNIDCIEGMADIDDNIIDLTVTDPPFDVNYDKYLGVINRKPSDKTYIRDNLYTEFKDFNYMKFAFELFRLMKKNTHLYLFCGSHQIFKWYDVLNNVGFNFSDILIWLKDKDSFSVGEFNYDHGFEACLMWSKGHKKLNKYKKRLSNVMRYNSDGNLHPCQRPINMYKYIIENSSDKDDLVFDPFMGSGTTAVSSKISVRHYIGFEINAMYCDIANKRVSDSAKNVSLLDF